ncbi:GNAT family N-acetyltransferase [Miniphocaeibacter halophilus]|uniref:N-acetyltransferase n=1 Tax=Miniphocaeibacter halophilus TaxID=2931922 RepID=A0AC61MTB9_9FIRM|nr:N-acetyltransferase [Miniphocaeibacter halophilus]QQK08826.1 N-acetyltransferase [Miniphocaeibacter halophilus]
MNIKNIIIRQENKKDYNNIYNLVKKSFKTAPLSDGKEHILVNSLRDSKAYIPKLSLVAEYNKEIVGYIMFTKVGLGNKNALALAPLAVAPGYQNLGIGKSLIEEGHKLAIELNYEYCLVLGSENYYPKFGYIPASKLGIKSPFNVPDENFMVVDFLKQNIKINETVKYPKEFFEL